jgi:hypothetical protein
MTKTAHTPPFGTELAVYNANLADLLKSHVGKFVLIHENEVVGVFDSELNALQAGYQRFGPVPLYIRQISPVEHVQSAPAMTFGILSMV